MKKSRYTEEQITYALRQAESGTPVADVCRQLGVSEASFYVWKKKYGKLGMSEIRELRQLREENSRLKRLVADLTLDKHISRGCSFGCVCAGASTCVCTGDQRQRRARRTSAGAWTLSTISCSTVVRFAS